VDGSGAGTRLFCSSVHVAHIIDRLDGIGGVQTYLADVVPALAQREIKSTLIVGHLNGESRFAGARLVSAPETQLDGPRMDDAASRHLATTLAELGVDACITHIAPSPAVAAVTARVTPTLVFAHDYYPACPGYARYLHSSERFCHEGPGLRCYARAYTERCTNRRPDRLVRATRRERAWRTGWDVVARIIVASPFVAGVLADDGAPADRTAVVPYFVPPATPSNDTERCDVLFMGRLVRLKGAHVLLRALAAIPDATAVIGGDGPERSHLERLASELNIADRVRFPGVVAPRERDRLLGGAKVFALPSLWSEPFGISGLEALAAGVPVVGSDTGGIPSWLPDNEAGLLVPPGEDGALADALSLVLSDDELRGRMAAAAQLTASRFSLDSHVDRLISLIVEAKAWAQSEPADKPGAAL